ncbi:hypothetical protein BJ508DRAFT_360943 [Ascobolus immersus RN42]|uniref:AN1-type domain-containing protein n=1 Tax=Ascobolus immersus RN42 TaxID=1160509 RepID=A0A3N4IBA2_ASCIM|nr:hypothetical protein BJ508DRAFT_360943 [Ascobolus immersus RN42]
MSKTNPQEHLKIGDSIGAHCDIPTCHVLDFLPFKCESCKGTYCLDHRSETAHKCPKAGEWARRRAEAARSSSSTPSSSTQPPKPIGGRNLTTTCHATSCNVTLDTPMQPRVTCSTCHHDYCLKHRLSTQHNCTPPPVPQAQQAKAKAVSALNRFKAWTATLPKTASSKMSALNTPSNSSRSATAPNGIIALRKVAKGDAKVQPGDRVYLWAEAAGVGELKREGMWFDKKWKVGRVLDKAAETLRVENKNNVGIKEEDRLRVFWVEGGRVLEFGEVIGTVKNADTIVLLRGVGEV